MSFLKNLRERNKKGLFLLFLSVFLFISGCRNKPAGVTITPTSSPIKKVTEEVTPTLVPSVTKGEVSETPPSPTKEIPSAISVTPVPVTGPAQLTKTPTMPPIPTKEVKPTMKPTVKPSPTEPPQLTPTKPPLVSPTELPTNFPTLEPTALLTPTEAPQEPTLAVFPTTEPDYFEILQSGYSRREDCFGNRQIYFSGMFRVVTVQNNENSYRYTYTSGLEDGITLSIAGEENKTAEEFTEELFKQTFDFTLQKESEGDYSYTYWKDGKNVIGRTYNCHDAGNVQRMRIEVEAPGAGLTAQTFFVVRTVRSGE